MLLAFYKCSPHQDVKLTASNDDYYFVFEDFLYQVRFISPSLLLCCTSTRVKRTNFSQIL